MKIAVLFLLCALASGIHCQRAPKLRYTIYVWIGSGATSKSKVKQSTYQTDLLVSDGLVSAGNLDSSVIPEFGEIDGRTEILSIGGNYADFANEYSFKFFALDAAPNFNHSPTADDLSRIPWSEATVENNKHYLFWLTYDFE